MRRLFPAPVLSATLAAAWLLLAQSVAPADLILAGVVAIAVPVAVAPLRPVPVRMRRPLVALRLLGRVLLDSLRSNVAVIRTIVSGRDPVSGFVRIPLDARDPNALAVLAMIVTATPGTVWAQVSADRTTLLIHVLSLTDEAAVIAMIKGRYERPLMEIFE